MSVKQRKIEFAAYLQRYRREQAEWRKLFTPAPKVRLPPQKRDVTIKQRTPAWADRMAIRCIYAECLLTTRRTGIRHHVDHVIPLVGETVSGLHVAENLRIIAALENMRKFNRFDGDVAPPLAPQPI